MIYVWADEHRSVWSIATPIPVETFTKFAQNFRGQLLYVADRLTPVATYQSHKTLGCFFLANTKDTWPQYQSTFAKHPEILAQVIEDLQSLVQPANMPNPVDRATVLGKKAILEEWYKELQHPKASS